MKNTEKSAIIELLIGKKPADAKSGRVADDFCVENALKWAEFWSGEYRNTHQMVDSSRFPEASHKLVTALYQWIVHEGKKELDYKFSAEEFQILSNTFISDLATPHDTEYMVSMVADDYGIDDFPFPETGVGLLLNKLARLTAIQKLALRDLLQCFLYPADGVGMMIDEYFQKNNVMLADAA
jgi:hypothetical protein